jgi:hypothetical protein
LRAFFFVAGRGKPQKRILSPLYKKDSAISIPVLNITYRNICDTNYYFFKVSSRKDESIMIVPVGMLLYFEDIGKYQRAKNHLNYANQKFNVIMGDTPWYNSGWNIFSESADYNKGFPDEEIAYDLFDIYEWVYVRAPEVSKNRPAYFVASDAIPDTILYGSVNDQFVFLKQNETHTDTYNLIGYKMVEGCFTFLVFEDVFKSYFFIYDNYDSVIKRYISTKIELPAIVGDYRLYVGAFNTNKVTVCFGNK